ncbi:MAG: enoyl-CoA hydratase/isomerase family protein [Candidatus Tectomicrobia bacterium]|uniref:Enoyl-CoA hydratase/isomerase family protein n=1 Tax=Tectimicrobiota bacterium TaxID=2528274 RepID=A0A933LQ45_UNCTE|nr:enoyl-CoA hydratase/isomerase family protein [Candidatus Tectomicrobia bacterium]
MVDYSNYKLIKVERDGKILNVIFNRPEAMNSVNREFHAELANIFADVQKDDDANVIVLTGAGKAFSAGGDIKGMDETGGHRNLRKTLWEGKKIINDILDLHKPIIAKVNGHAIGLGATIALFCDVIFAADHAKFGDPHVKVGIVAGDGGAIIWPALIGMCRAKEYLMTGDLISAKDAERMGLINRAVPADKLDATVKEFASRLAYGPIQAIEYTKVSVNKTLKAMTNLIIDTSIAYEGHTFYTDDHKEAMKAFIEKREPKFTGN